MSDCILKFWPKNEVEIDKTQAILNELKLKNILGNEKDFWGEPAFSLTENTIKLIAPNADVNHPAFQKMAVFVKSKDYGIGFGEEDWEYYDRLNVVTINGGDGELDRSKEFCAILFQITGDEYSVEFEII